MFQHFTNYGHAISVRRNSALALDGYENGSDNGDPPIIYIKTLSDRATIPSRASPLSAGYQLSSAESVRIPARGRVLVKTNWNLRSYYCSTCKFIIRN